MTWIVTSSPLKLSFSNDSWPTHVCDEQVSQKTIVPQKTRLSFGLTCKTPFIFFPLLVVSFVSSFHPVFLKIWKNCKTVDCEHSHGRQSYVSLFLKTKNWWLPLRHDKTKLFSCTIFSPSSIDLIVDGSLWQIWWTQSSKLQWLVLVLSKAWKSAWKKQQQFNDFFSLIWHWNSGILRWCFLITWNLLLIFCLGLQRSDEVLQTVPKRFRPKSRGILLVTLSKFLTRLSLYSFQTHESRNSVIVSH